MKSLIVNADDYGLTPGVSSGIRHANLNGIVTSTTAMMNMAHAADALRAAATECPNLGLGVHLTLTAGSPVLPLDEVASIVDQSGRFYRPEKVEARLQALDTGQVLAEWHAQIDRFCQITGHGPDHLDGHHHIPYLPPLFDLMLQLAAEYNCPVRSPIPDTPSREAIIDQRPELVAEARRKFAERKVRTTEHMSIAFYDENATFEVIDSLLAALQDGVTEIMSHPGYADAELFAISSYNRQREKELALLTSPEVRKGVESRGIRLVNFSSLSSAVQAEDRP